MRGIANHSKPTSAPEFKARFNRETNAWEVIGPDGRVVDRAFASQGSAATFAGVHNRQARAAARKKDRPCLCCQTVFPSEGIHNRLCNNCRNRGSADAMPDGYSFGSMTGRKRA